MLGGLVAARCLDNLRAEITARDLRFAVDLFPTYDGIAGRPSCRCRSLPTCATVGCRTILDISPRQHFKHAEGLFGRR